VRTIRKDKNIPFKDAIELMAINNDNVSTYFDSIVSKLGNISSLQYVTEKSRWSLVLPCKFKRVFHSDHRKYKCRRNCQIDS
jgi:valyl-tRNA synthetase